jgi:hypothetical protein
LFCPKCKSEFREGFTQCTKCNTDLVEELIEESDRGERKIKSLLKIMDINIEKWLKLGSIYYVIISISSDLISFLVKLLFPADLLAKTSLYQFVINFSNLCNTIINNILWGLFFFGFGKIIEMLKEGNKK